MDMKKYENKYYKEGFKLIAGVDEVGRGPLAGPVYAAAVILPAGEIIEGVNDSKKLTEKKREVLYDIIDKKAVCWAVGSVDADIIDKINIRQATHIAMKKAIDTLKFKAEFLLIDGNDKIPFDTPFEYIVKGDMNSQSIAAASIIAKVTRDRYMKELSKVYPLYGFEKHKGYGTMFHMEAIRKYGLCPLHRKSFITPKVLGVK